MHNHRKMQRPREEEYNNSIHVVQQLKLLPRRRRQKQEQQSRCAAGGTSLARSFSDPPPSPAKRCKTRETKKANSPKTPHTERQKHCKTFFFFFAGGPMHLAAVIAYIRAGALAYYFGCIRMNMIFLIHVLYFRVSMMFLDERDIYHLHTL